MLREIYAGRGASRAPHWGAMLLQPFWVLALLAGSLIVGAARAETSSAVFGNLQLPGGAAFNRVQCLTFDDLGFAWLGTEAGLVVYDGNDFTVFRHDPTNPLSISHHSVTALAKDADGVIWVGTEWGQLDRFDARTQSFQAIDLGLPDGHQTGTFMIHPESPGRIWVGGGYGVVRVDRNTAGEFRGQLIDATPTYDFWQSPEGSLWIANRQGLSEYDAATGQFVVRQPLRGLALDQSEIWALTGDAQGRLWYGGTASGLHLFDPVTGSQQSFAHSAAQAHSLVDDTIYALLPAPDGSLWVGTYLGLDRLDFSTLETGARFTHFRSRQDLPGSIGHPYVSELTYDNAGTLWVSTFGGGVGQLDPLGLLTRSFVHDVDDPNSLSENWVSALHIAANGDQWVGTYNNGVNRIEADSGRVHRFEQAAFDVHGHRRHIWQFLEDRADRLWVTSSSGASVLHPGSQEFVALREAYPEADMLSDADVWSVDEDMQGRIWFATYGEGLVRLDPASGAVTQFRQGYQGLTDNYVADTAVGSDGVLYFATYNNGVVTYQEGQFEPLLNPAIDTPLSMVMLGEDGLWVGSRGGGLYHYQHGGSIRRFDESHGLPSRFVQAARYDNQGVLWVSTDNGLARFDLQRERFVPVSMSGLGNSSFLHDAFEIDANGNIWLGTTEGLRSAPPESLTQTTPSLRPYVAQVQSQVAIYPLRFSGPGRLALELDAQESTLRFDFSSVFFGNTSQINYRYRLLGLSDYWSYGDSDHRSASFANLSSGHYQFELQAQGVAGNWVDAMPLRLSIATPWWRSNLAMFAYALVLLLVTAAVWIPWWLRQRERNRLHDELADREQRLDLALWGSGNWLFDWYLLERTIYCPQMCEFLGLTEGNGWMRPGAGVEAFQEAIHAQDAAGIPPYLRGQIKDSDDLEYDMRMVAPDRSWRWMRVRGKVVERNAQGLVVRVTGTCKDVTELKDAENNLRLAARVLDNSHDCIAIMDADHRFLQVNKAFEEVTGFSEEEVIGRPPSILSSGAHDHEVEEARRVLGQRGSWHAELWEKRKSGELFYSDLSISEVRDDNGVLTHYVSSFSDITHKYQTQKDLRFLANYDSLTRLPNRTLFSERLTRGIVTARKHGSVVTVLLVDLDDFKLINETRGPSAGDEVLRQIAARLKSSVREEDTVARLSGNEFAVLIEDQAGQQDTDALIARTQEILAQPLDLVDGAVTVRASMGVALYPKHGEDAQILMQNAAAALVAAKLEQRGGAQIFAGDLRSHALSRMQVAHDLQLAVDRNELRLLYQPKIAVDTGQVVGVEALLRWQRADGTLMAPEQFIPIAERRGMIQDIGRWVLATACQQIAGLTKHDLNPVPLAVNVSPRQAESEALAQEVAEALQTSGLAPDLLQLELTETTMMTHTGRAIRLFEEIRCMNVQIVVDDFGTGYSSLGYLNQLPVDRIKIDKSFVSNLETDQYSHAIVIAILSMADSLGLKVTAEGVERAEQVEMLRAAGCQEMQGYLFSQPLEYDALIAFLQQSRNSVISIPTSVH